MIRGNLSNKWPKMILIAYCNYTFSFCKNVIYQLEYPKLKLAKLLEYIKNKSETSSIAFVVEMSV